MLSTAKLNKTFCELHETSCSGNNLKNETVSVKGTTIPPPEFNMILSQREFRQAVREQDIKSYDLEKIAKPLKYRLHPGLETTD